MISINVNKNHTQINVSESSPFFDFDAFILIICPKYCLRKIFLLIYTNAMLMLKLQMTRVVCEQHLNHEQLSCLISK